MNVMDGLVFLVDLAVATRHLEGLVGIEPRERVQGIVHHFGDETAEVAYLPVIVRRLLHGGEARGDVADLLDLVADALEISDGLDDRDHHAQVRGGRLPGGDDPAALLVDLDLHPVDPVVVARDLLAERAVAIDERRDGALELLLHEAAHLHGARSDPLHVLVEAARGVLPEVCRFHRFISCRCRCGPGACASYQCCDSRAGKSAAARRWRTSSPLTRNTTCSATFFAWSPIRSRLFKANTVSKTDLRSRDRSMATVISCRSAASNSWSISRSRRATSCATLASPRSSASTATRIDSEASSAM
jgi:hypothetical protein